jgi:hypothetical protein
VQQNFYWKSFSHQATILAAVSFRKNLETPKVARDPPAAVAAICDFCMAFWLVYRSQNIMQQFVTASFPKKEKKKKTSCTSSVQH